MSTTQTSLMKKTKAELVDIILRKDDVENGLRKQLANVELDFNKAKKMDEQKDVTIKSLRNELETSEKEVNAHQDIIDELTSENAAIEHKYRIAKGWNIALTVIIVALGIALIIL